MAYADELQQFKKFNRQRRTQYSEESFASGIKYATSPLALGFARNLVNFDLGEDGDSLLPRRGLRTFEVSQEVDLTNAEEYDPNTATEKQIYHASENTEEDHLTYRQMLMGNVNVTDENKEKVVKTGDLNLITIYPEGHGGTVIPYANSEVITVLAQHTEDYSNYEFFFNSPNMAEIHGIPLEDASINASHIGTELAAEGTKKYYCFRRNKETGETKPVFITFDKAKGCYVFEELTPQTTTAYYATLSMYNMLQDNPYEFVDQYGAGTLQFMGCYVTDLEGIQRQATYINTNYYFRMNYAAPKGGKYKVIWEWKEPVSSSWTELETQYYDFTEETPPKMQVKWTSPASAVILRVQAYPVDNEREIVDLLTFSSEAPATASQGDKYFNPDTRKIYTYSGTAWAQPVLPLTSVIYKRLDDKDTLYRWLGNQMGVTDEYTYISSQAILVNVTFGEAMSDSSQNLELANYDLATCRGMVTWGQRVCVYAPDKALNMLFVSEPNNPAWFPYPRNVSLFNENIIKCVAYLDYLLVFTTDAIYQLTLTDDGDGWTERCLQKNLNIQMCDVPLIKIIKNMVFFKSNNYFYMVVPSTTSTTGLSVAPISTNIELLLDDFAEAIEEMMVEVYDNKVPFKLVKFKNHVNYKNIFNIYTFQSDRGMYFNIYLIYNIETRYWTIYCIESKTFIDSYKIDVADVNIYMAYTPIVINGKLSHGIQFSKYDDNRHDFYIHPYLTPDDYIEKICEEDQFFKNYQYIDTGYREHESDFKKRYRELQFKLNNYAQLDLTFYTQFMIDGYMRQNEATYEVTQIVDKDDPRYGVIEYSRVYDEEAGHFVPGATILGETPLLPDEEGRLYRHNPEEQIRDKLMWKLNISEFPETVFWKTRFPVSGKGYVPRLKILNMDQEKYEMLNISWVFRSLYSR
jgi:hypothetical protein